MTIVGELAQWVHGLDYDQIPERVREKARLQLLSVLGAIHASARHELGQKTLRAVESWAGDGPCTVIPTGRKVDLLSAVWANAALSLALDYDDYLLFGHTCHSAVAVSLAVAERERQSLKLALTAQVAANEIEGRLGAAVSLGPHNGQTWSHIHLAGAAAAAAKVLDLSADQTAHALAIALYQPTYVLIPGFMGPDSKATTAATPSVTGVQAALFAAAGATGPLDVIEHPQGYLARFSYLPMPFFISGLGRSWVTDTLAFKIYPGCAYIDTTVDATLALRSEYEEETGRPLDPADVADILVEATVLTVEMDKLSKTGGSFDPQNPVSINFSIPGNVALALLTGRLSTDDLGPEQLRERRAAIEELSRKVRLTHDWPLTIGFLETMGSTLKLREVLGEIKLKDLIGVRRRAQEQYRSSLGFSWNDFRAVWTQAPELRSRLWSGLKRRVENLALGGGRRPGFDLGRCPLDAFRMPFAARVTLTLKGGRSLTRLQEIPLAGPGHPLAQTQELVREKYAREAGPTLDDKKVAALLKLAPALETRISVKKLMELCCR
jgi:2-methylcitrate dehydratase PrpD